MLKKTPFGHYLILKKWLIFFMLAVPIGLALAIFLNQVVFGIRLVKSLFFFPFVISQAVIGIVFAWFYQPTYGVLVPFFDLIALSIECKYKGFPLNG